MTITIVIAVIIVRHAQMRPSIVVVVVIVRAPIVRVAIETMVMLMQAVATPANAERRRHAPEVPGGKSIACRVGVVINGVGARIVMIHRVVVVDGNP